MFVTAILVWAQQRVLSGKSPTPPWPARLSGRRSLDLGAVRWFTFGLAVIYSLRRRRAADLGADHRGLPASSCSSRTSTRCST
jgi:hypothetical protein